MSIKKQIIDIVLDEMDVDLNDIDDDTEIDFLDVDSNKYELAFLIEEKLGLVLDEDVIETWATFKDLVDYFEKADSAG